MVDVILLILVICLLIFAVKGTIKHFKGDSSCCGGSSNALVTPQKKLENSIIGQKKINILGMHCENCERSIENELNKIDGLIAKADFKKGVENITYDRVNDEEKCFDAIKKAGFDIKK